MPILSSATRVLTPREQRRNLTVALVTVLTAAVCWWVGAVIGSLFAFPDTLFPTVELRPLWGPAVDGGPPPFQSPIDVQLPDLNWRVGAVIGLVLFIGAFARLIRPYLRSRHVETRHLHLATPRQIRAKMSRRAVRRTTKFTLPGQKWLARRALPMRTCGMYLGRAITPRVRELWADWETRIRIIALPGWGKTTRLLIPIIRDLPGAALVASVEPEIFEATVQARASRIPDGRSAHIPQRRAPNPFAKKRRARLARPQRDDYPVAIANCARNPVAGDYPPVQWNPIPGSEDWNVATRRARSLAMASDSNAGSAEDNGFWRDSATAVLAAWLHAAALDPHKSIECTTFSTWLSKNDTATPERILTESPYANPQAALNLRTHLSAKAERTTSSVERFLVLALASLNSDTGRVIVGSRHDSVGVLDMEWLVREEGTLYLIAEPDVIEQARPLLSMLADEFLAATEAVARAGFTRHGRTIRRLPRPMFAVLDEIRFGVRVARLPYVANTSRKFGIGYVYACTNGNDEQALYGEDDAKTLRNAARLTIVGGFDEDTHQMITDRAGEAPIVVAAHGHGGRNISETERSVLSAADQHRMADGDAIMVAPGVPPFLAHIPATFESRALRKTIAKERLDLAQASRP